MGASSRFVICRDGRSRLAHYFQSESRRMGVPFGRVMTGGNWWRGISARGKGRQVTPMWR